MSMGFKEGEEVTFWQVFFLDLLRLIFWISMWFWEFRLPCCVLDFLFSRLGLLVCFFGGISEGLI